MSSFLPPDAEDALVALGQRLRERRLARNERQAVLASRLRISVPTLRAMERGEPTTQIGYWVTVLWMMDRLGELDPLFSSRQDLFAEARRRHEAQGRIRRRARRIRS